MPQVETVQPDRPGRSRQRDKFRVCCRMCKSTAPRSKRSLPLQHPCTGTMSCAARPRRARVSLNDGSLLNLGSNSALRVLQHDAQAQQTSLDLAVGRMRGQVVKLSRPGAKFEIRTPAGVAGLVGTDFYLLATPDYTELIVFEGVVRFTSIANGQAVTTPAGMKLRISQDGAIAGPLVASPEETKEAKDSTDVPETLAQRTQTGGKSSLVLVKISVVTGAAAIGIGFALTARETISPSKP